MPDDLMLPAMVDELAWTLNVDAAHIGATVKNGIVSLSGIVHNLAEKVAAERTALRVKGVQGAAQKLVVRPPSGHHWSHVLSHCTTRSKKHSDAMLKSKHHISASR